MNLFLSDLSQPSSDHLGIWMICAVFVGNFVIGLAALLYQRHSAKNGAIREISPQPLEVRAATEYATREELKKVEERFGDFATQIENRFNALDKKRSDSIAGLHKSIEDKTESLRREMKDDIGRVHSRVNLVLQGVAEIKGKVL